MEDGRSLNDLSLTASAVWGSSKNLNKAPCFFSPPHSLKIVSLYFLEQANCNDHDVAAPVIDPKNVVNVGALNTHIYTFISLSS